MNRILALLPWLLAAGAAAQEAPPPAPARPEPQAVREAPRRAPAVRFSRNLRILADSRVMDLTRTLQDLQWGTLVGALPPELRQGIREVSLRLSGSGYSFETYRSHRALGRMTSLPCSLQVMFEAGVETAVQIQASELLAAGLKARLAKETELLAGQMRAGLQEAPARLAELENRRQELQAQLEQIHLEGVRHSPEGEIARTGELSSQLSGQEAEAALNLAARRARLKALSETIVRIGKEAMEAGQGGGDPIAAELANIVDARERALERVKALHKSGAGSNQDLEEARTQLSEARIALLERREALARESGSLELLARLKGEQAELMLELAELETRLEATRESLKGLKVALDGLREMAVRHRVLNLKREPLEEELGQLKRAHREAAAAVEQLKALEAGVTPPQVNLLD